MNLIWVLLIVLVVLALSGGFYGYHGGYYRGPNGGLYTSGIGIVGLIVIVLVVLLLLGRI
jgi:uncharacterized membrane protein